VVVPHSGKLGHPILDSFYFAFAVFYRLGRCPRPYPSTRRLIRARSKRGYRQPETLLGSEGI
jgi:hypothetical protein